MTDLIKQSNHVPQSYKEALLALIMSEEDKEELSQTVTKLTEENIELKKFSLRKDDKRYYFKHLKAAYFLFSKTETTYLRSFHNEIKVTYTLVNELDSTDIKEVDENIFSTLLCSW